MKPVSASPVQELLDKTSNYNEELERFKLKMMLRDIKHRKTLMLLRVPGLQNIAPHFKYFQEAVESRRLKSQSAMKKKKMSMKDRILCKAMLN